MLRETVQPTANSSRIMQRPGAPRSSQELLAFVFVLFFSDIESCNSKTVMQILLYVSQYLLISNEAKVLSVWSYFLLQGQNNVFVKSFGFGNRLTGIKSLTY